MHDLLAIARKAGWQAAAVLRSQTHATLDIQHSADGPVTAADLAANHAILDTLQTALGEDANFAYLTEETYKSQPTRDRLNAPKVWIIDPLDGTKEFINQTGEYAVHIALVSNHRPVLAVVVRPAAEKLYFAAVGQGTFVETPDGTVTPVQVSHRNQLEELVVVTSRSHRSERFNQLMQQFPCQKQKSVGSLGGKLAAIAEQEADVYLSLSGTSAPKDWDLAAPELILTEAGGKLTHFDGSSLLYNREDVSQWGGILASNGACHETLCDRANAILSTL